MKQRPEMIGDSWCLNHKPNSSPPEGRGGVWEGVGQHSAAERAVNPCPMVVSEFWITTIFDTVWKWRVDFYFRNPFQRDKGGKIFPIITKASLTRSADVSLSTKNTCSDKHCHTLLIVKMANHPGDILTSVWRTSQRPHAKLWSVKRSGESKKGDERAEGCRRHILVAAGWDHEGMKVMSSSTAATSLVCTAQGVFSWGWGAGLKCVIFPGV